MNFNSGKELLKGTLLAIVSVTIGFILSKLDFFQFLIATALILGILFLLFLYIVYSALKSRVKNMKNIYLAFLFFMLIPISLFYFKEKVGKDQRRKADKVIEKIEQVKNETGFYPRNCNDFLSPEECKFFNYHYDSTSNVYRVMYDMDGWNKGHYYSPNKRWHTID